MPEETTSPAVAVIESLRAALQTAVQQITPHADDNLKLRDAIRTLEDARAASDSVFHALQSAPAPALEEGNGSAGLSGENPVPSPAADAEAVTGQGGLPDPDDDGSDDDADDGNGAEPKSGRKSRKSK